MLARLPHKADDKPPTITGAVVGKINLEAPALKNQTRRLTPNT